MAARLITRSSNYRLHSIRSFSSKLALSQQSSTSTPEPSISQLDDSPSVPGYEPTYEPPSLESGVPRATLRALFALHHSASSFITPENIDQKINDEFASSNQSRLYRDHGRTMVSLDELKKELSEISQRPTLTEDIQVSVKTDTLNDTRRMHWREEEVKAALWGSTDTKPGLEIVEDFLAESQKQKGRRGHRGE